MNIADFESSLHRENFDEVKVSSLPAGHAASEHDHPFEVRGFVTAGDITFTVDGTTRTYRPGEVFAMPLRCRHAESVGPEGVHYLVGRRYGT